MASLVSFPRARLLWLLLAVVPAALPAQTETRSATATADELRAPSRALPPLTQRIVIEGTTRALADTKITNLAGRDVSAALAPKTDGRGLSVTMGAEPFVMKPRKISTVSLGDGDTMLPGELVTALEPEREQPTRVALSASPHSGTRPKRVPPPAPTPTFEPSPVSASAPAPAPEPTRDGASAVTVLRLVVSASPRPVPWEEAAGNYVTRLKFAVLPANGAPISAHLPQPIEVSLDFEGMKGPAIAPFLITDIGLTHEKEFDLQFVPLGAEPKLRIRSTITDADVRIEALPRLVLLNEQADVLGFGLETFTVTVERQRPQGDPDVVTASTPVNMKVSGAARLLGNDAVIPAGESRVAVELRSGGLVPLRVSATIGGQTASVIVRQHFPYGPLFAALLGGALGGFARRWVKGARKQVGGRHTLEGMVVGFIAFVAAVLGVGYLDLPAAIAATEAGAFLTGALCGFAGVVVLSKLSQPKGADA